jgi:Protein of unknown function (DUF3606)
MVMGATYQLSRRGLIGQSWPARISARDSDMAGLKDKRGFIDKDRLDLSERQAVEYWMKRWGVTRDQLTAAHRRAGRMVKDIAADLGKKR